MSTGQGKAVASRARTGAGDEAPLGRLLRRGAAALSDGELLGVLFGGRLADSSARRLARKVLRASGGLAGLVGAGAQGGPIGDLPEAPRAVLLAARELAARLAQAQLPGRPLASPDLVARYLYLRFGRQSQEVFGVVFLDCSHRLLGVEELFRGGRSAATVEAAPILRQAVERRADGVILFHTHPSGVPAPSQHDLRCHRQMEAACELVGVELVDNLIVGSGRRWTSLRYEVLDGARGPVAGDAAVSFERWLLARRAGNADDPRRQCLSCSGYVRLSGPLGAGWGVCANGQSSRDGGLVHQRDGCAAFAARAEFQVASKPPARRLGCRLLAERREEARREEEDDAEARAGDGAAKGGE